jgi:glycosyltransferase involved in cell wall biosynthesis
VRIVQVNKYYFPPHLGGVEQSLNLLATRLVERGHDVTAIVANEGRARIEETLAGVHVTRLPRAFAFASTPVAPGMPGAIRAATVGSAAADVVHMHFPYPWGDISWLLSGGQGPSVMTYHSDVVRQKRLLTGYAPLLRAALARVDRIIVGAPQIAEYSPFVSPHMDKVRVVPFAIDPARFVAAEQIEARAQAICADHPRKKVLFVGRLVYYKGVGVLVEAMAAVDADLVIVGRGPLEAELRAQAAELGIAERLTFISGIDDTELAAWYRAADVFCLPSTEPSEAYGLVQLESHLSGTPVVSTNLRSGVPFVNLDGVTGFVVEPGDSAALALALSRILGDDTLRGRMGEAAKARASTEFSLATMVDQTLAVYAEAIESHGREARRG